MFKDRLKKKLRNLSLMKVSAITMSMILCLNSIVTAKQFEVGNTAPIGNLNASVLHKKKLSLQVLTDYTGQKSTDAQTKLNKFKTDMITKKVDVEFSLINNTSNIIHDKDKENIFIHLSDGVGTSFSFTDLNKKLMNKLVSNNFSIYSITPKVNWDYKIPGSITQDITINQLVNSSPIDGKLYDSSTGGLSQLDALLSYLNNKYSSNEEDLYTIESSKKVDLVVSTDYTGTKLDSLKAKLNNLKARGTVREVDVQYNIVDGNSKTYLGPKSNEIKDFASATKDLTAILNKDGTVWVAYQDNAIRVKEITDAKEISCAEAETADSSILTVLKNDGSTTKVLFNKSGSYEILNNYNYDGKVYIDTISSTNQTVAIDTDNNAYDLDDFRFVGSGVSKILSTNNSGTAYVYKSITDEIGYFGFASRSKSFKIIKDTLNAKDVAVASNKTFILLSNGTLQFFTIQPPDSSTISYPSVQTGIENIVNVELAKDPTKDSYLYLALDSSGRVYSTKAPGTKMQLISGAVNIKKIYTSGAKVYFIDISNQAYSYNWQLTTPTLERLPYDTTNTIAYKTNNTGELYRLTTDGKIADGTYSDIMKNFNSSSYNVYGVNLDKVKGFSLRSDSERYFLYISDGEGTKYPKGFGGYYSIGGLNNSFKDYLKNNNIIPYIFSPSSDHEYIMKSPDINVQKQEISLKSLTEECMGKLFNNTEIDKALDDFIMNNVDIKYITDSYTNSSEYNNIISKTNNLNTELYPFNTKLQFQPSKDIMNGIVSDNEVVQVSIGSDYSAFLTKKGELYVVGDNTSGELGLGDNYSRVIPTKVEGLPKIKQVNCGGSGAIFIISETGELYGSGGYLPGGVSSTTFIKIEGIPKVKQISLGGREALILTEDGEVYSTSGVYSYAHRGTIMTQFVKVENLPKIKQISGSSSNSVILAEDGRVFTKGGNNLNYHLGIESNASPITDYVEVPVSVKVRKVETGSSNYAMITEDGELYVVGRNYIPGTGVEGVIGVTGLSARWYTKINNIPKVKDIDFSYNWTVILTEEGDLYAAGDGNIDNIPFYFSNGFKKIENGLNPEMKSIEGIEASNGSIVVLSKGEPYAIGNNSDFKLGVGKYTYDNNDDEDDGIREFTKVIFNFNTGIKKISSGIKSTFYSKDNADLYLTGQYSDYAGGISNEFKTFYKEKGMPKVKDVFASHYSVGVITENDELYVRGENGSGELGVGSTYSINFTRVEGIPKVKEVSFGSGHSLLLTIDGEVYAAGSGTAAGLKNINTTTTFMKIEGLPKIKQISCGAGSSLLLTEGGDVLTTTNTLTNIDGGFLDNKYYKILGLPKIKRVINGRINKILISEDGEVFVNGYNYQSCLGVDTTINIKNIFVKVDGLPRIKDAHIQDYNNNCFALLISEEGELFFSGYDANSCITGIPNGSGTNKTTFTKIPNLPRMKQLSGGMEFVMALSEDEQIYLANGNSISSSRVEVKGTGYLTSWNSGFGKVSSGLPSPGFKIDTSNLKRFTGKNDKYLLYVGNGTTLKDLSYEYRQHLIANKVTFLGVSPSNTFDNSIGSDTFRGLANITSGDLFEALDGAISFIKAKYTQLLDTRKSGYIAINEDRLKYSKTYDDYERDKENKNQQYKERWNYAQNKDFFENSMGYINDSITMADYNSGKRNWSDYLLSFITEKDFNRVGEYIVSYQAQDNPSIGNVAIDGTSPDYSKFENYNKTSIETANSKVKVYANRRPIAKFTYTTDGINFSKNNTSFDYDHLSKANKGIVNSIWKYKTIDDSNWTIGEPPSTFGAGKTYIVSLTVKDEDGYVSKPYTRIVGIQDNLPPVAEFTLDKNVMDYNKTQTNLVHDYSSDAEGDPLTYHWWAVDKTTGATVKDWGTNTPNIQDLVNIAKSLGVNKTYVVKLQVEDNPSANPSGGRTGLPKLKSNIAEQQLLIGKNTAPIADFDMKAAMLEGSMNTITDKSYDPDADPIQEYHWWVLDKASGFPLSTFTDLSSSPNLSLLPVGDYKVKLVVKDKPKFGEALESTPCIKDLKVLPKNSGLIIDATPTFMYWTNKEISVDIEAKGGYNFKFMQWAWSKSYNKPTFIESNKSTNMKQNVKLHNLKENEGMWYLHMKGQDEFSEAYNYRYFYCMDVTKPIITYDIKTFNLNVVDALSGVKENGVSYRWLKSATKLSDSDFTGFTVWDGLETVTKPLGNNLYLHVKAFDNAGNMGYEVFGPYNDPISIEGELIPGTVKRGQKVTFNITVTGAKTLTINFPADIISKDPNPTVNIDKFKNMPVSKLETHTLTYTYYVPIEAIEKDGYKFTAVAENNGATASCDMFLNVRGSIYDGLKTEIKY